MLNEFILLGSPGAAGGAAAAVLNSTRNRTFTQTKGESDPKQARENENFILGCSIISLGFILMLVFVMSILSKYTEKK
jgi:hypothetical protein